MSERKKHFLVKTQLMKEVWGKELDNISQNDQLYKGVITRTYSGPFGISVQCVTSEKK